MKCPYCKSEFSDKVCRIHIPICKTSFDKPQKEIKVEVPVEETEVKEIKVVKKAIKKAKSTKAKGK